MLVIEADIHEYVGMSYVDKNISGPLVHMGIDEPTQDPGQVRHSHANSATNWNSHCPIKF